MNNQVPSNRVEMELNQWRSKEERFSKLFSFSLSSNRSLLKEKLRNYERIAAKYKGTKNVDERFALQLLKQERNHLEKQLYPNLLIRLLRRLLVNPLREQIVIQHNVREVKQNSQSLQNQLQRAGFNRVSIKMDEQIRQGQQQFSIPVSYYINENERLDHQLSFAKDQAGQYQFEGYKTSLHNEMNPEENKQQYFSMKNSFPIDAKEAHNLLAGRAIQKEGTWIQFDMNDKDSQGNFRIKEFHSGYGYDLEKILQQLPLKELLNRNEADKLHNALKQGSRQAVSFIKDGKEERYYIVANPQFKSVNIYDEHSRKITLQTALGHKAVEAVKSTHKVNEQQQQRQAKKTGVRAG